VNKSFLVLFFKKELLACFLCARHDGAATGAMGRGFDEIYTLLRGGAGGMDGGGSGCVHLQ
jgi:hypothetical protein